MSFFDRIKLTDTTGTKVAEVGTRYQTPTGNALQVQIGPGDVISNIPVFIDYEHHQVHEGETWQWNYFTALNTATYDVRISVPVLTATIRTPHLLTEVIADNTSTRMFFYEGTTWTSGGTDNSSRIYNRNRNVAGSPSTKIYIAGGTALTPNVLGTEIWSGYLFAGAKGALATDRAGHEWDLRSNTEYHFRITTTGNGNVMIRFTFYEDLGV